MENNGIQSNNGHQDSTIATESNVVTFPQNDDTRTDDLSALMHDAPVMQRQEKTPADNAIASAADFEQLNPETPFYRRLGPKATASAALAGLLILPASLIFLSGGGKKTANKQQAVDPEGTSEQTMATMPEDYAAMQAELEQLRAQQAFIDQQVDADAIDAMGKQKQQAAQPKTADRPKPATAAKPAPPSRATTVSTRPAPARVATPAPRPAPVAANPQPTRIIQAPTPARAEPPVDPFERRAQLQAMGTYGAPPPMAQSARARTVAANPFESDSSFVQAIALEPAQAEPSFSAAQAAPVERPLTEEELQYQEDANAVLAIEEPDVVESEVVEPNVNEVPTSDSAVLDLRSRMSQSSEESREVARSTTSTSTTASPMAIMPGTSAQAELPYGFSWQEGTQLPEILLMTTEDITAGDRSVIPSGTQFLGQAHVDPSSGAVNIQVVGIFGETHDIQIPSASVVVRSADGGVLMAKANGGPSRSSGPNISGFLMESLGNSVGNILGNGDSVLEDVGGGIAETIIDEQVARSRAGTAARNSRAASQPVVWTLGEQSVQLTFNNYIPLDSASR